MQSFRMHLRGSSPVRSRSTLRIFAAAALVGALSLVGCAGTAPAADQTSAAADEQPAEDLQKMVFLSYLPFDTLSLAPEMLAYAAGYFEDEGLDVQLQPVIGSPAAIQGLIGGLAPITRVGGIDVLTTAAQSQSLISVATLERGGGFRMVSSADNPFEDIKDLPGATIGVGSIGGTSEKTIKLALAAAGLDPSSVNLQVVGLTAATFSLVQQGLIDAYLLGTDTALIVGAQNEDAVVSPPEMLTAPTDVQVYASTAKGIEAHSDQIERFLRAIKRAVEFIEEDEELDESLEIIDAEFDFAALEDKEVAKEALDAYRQIWLGDGEHDLLENDLDRWEKAYGALVDGGLAPAGGEPLTWVTNDFVPTS